MMTDIWTERLSEYVDGELTASETAAMEAHLTGCAECRRIADDLRAVARTAAALRPDTPDRDLWPGILDAIAPDAGVIPIKARRRWHSNVPRLAAAAVVIATLSGGSVWLAMHNRATTTSPLAGLGMPAPSQVTLVPASARAERTYDAAVADLRAVLDSGRGRLDSTTIAVLERNLSIIDSAVADAQRAVNSDPNNVYLNTYLARTMRRKIDLLRQAAMLARAET